MNALISVRNNAQGSLSPTPAQRREALEKTTALLRASLAARLRLVQGATATATADGSTSASGAKSAAKSAQKSTAAEQSGTATSETSTVSNKQELGRDAFLQLLVQQMQYQDPLDPVSNTDMIAQLAQFSSLEQMNNLNTSFANVGGNIDQLNFISAGGLVGRNVYGVDLDGKAVSGTVTAVTMKDSLVYLSVGDQVMSMAGVQRME